MRIASAADNHLHAPAVTPQQQQQHVQYNNIYSITIYVVERVSPVLKALFLHDNIHYSNITVYNNVYSITMYIVEQVSPVFKALFLHDNIHYSNITVYNNVYSITMYIVEHVVPVFKALFFHTKGIQFKSDPQQYVFCL